MKTIRRLPRSRNDWDLYDKPGVQEAVKSINQAVKESNCTIRANLIGASTAKRAHLRIVEAYDFARKNLRAKMQEHVQFGTMDTEPQAAAHRALVILIARRFKLDEAEFNELFASM